MWHIVISLTVQNCSSGEQCLRFECEAAGLQRDERAIVRVKEQTVSTNLLKGGQNFKDQTLGIWWNHLIFIALSLSVSISICCPETICKFRSSLHGSLWGGRCALKNQARCAAQRKSRGETLVLWLVCIIKYKQLLIKTPCKSI